MKDGRKTNAPDTVIAEPGRSVSEATMKPDDGFPVMVLLPTTIVTGAVESEALEVV